MDNYSFYKSLYDRELNRRGYLDSAINFPVTVLTITVASNSYLFKDDATIHNLHELGFKHLMIAILMTTLFIALFYMMKSANNFFKGFAYKNFSYLTSILKYQREIEEYNKSKDDSSKISFEEVIILKLVALTDDHIIFNDKRSNDLRKAKKFLILSVVLTSANFLITLINYIKI